MSHFKIVISLCGTSCLTFHAENARRLLTKYANAASINETDNRDGAEISKVIARARQSLLSGDIQQARRISAEINSLAAFYDDRLQSGKSDQHILLHTDTWLGKEAAEIVREFLGQQGFQNVSLQTFGGLRTDSLTNFRAALGEMVKWIHESFSGMDDKLVFNLTGGFKSVQGFLQTVGLLYNAERIYLFESSNELLHIPRLPARLAVEDQVKQHLHAIRRLASGLPAAGNIPELFVLELEGDRILSEWGELIWGQLKNIIYRERLWPTPSNRIRFTTRFEEQARSLPGDKKLQVNLRMDELACNLELPDRPNPKSLNFKALQGNPYPPCTHELRAWSDGNASRIFGWFDEQTFVIERLEKHL